MVEKYFTLSNRIEELLNIISFIDCFSEVAIIDNYGKIISLKSQGIISNQDLASIFETTKRNYIEFKIPFLFGDYNRQNLISFYFCTRDSELVLVGLSKYEDLGVREISVFKLIALSIRDIFEVVEIVANFNSKFRDLEFLLSFYKSITTPIDKELFLAYILDNIISEISAEVGSIMILDKDLSPVANFYLGLDENLSQKIFEFLKRSSEITNITIFSTSHLSEIIQSDTKDIKGVIYYPIKFEEEVVGAVILANKRIGINYIPFSNSDIEKLRILLAPVSIVIKNYSMFREFFLLNQFNQRILSNISTIIAMTDKNYKIKYLNKERYKELADTLINISKDKELQILSDRGVEIKIGESFYEVKSQPIFDESGEIIEIVWTIEDITYRKELINRYVISEKMNIMSEIVSGIAHEIRNPISSISGFIELLKIRKDDQSFIEKFIEIASKDIERIINLLNSFIRFAKPIEYEFSEISINSVIAETLDVLMYQTKQKNIEIINKIDKNLVIKGNHSLLLQVFTNILLNSIQAINHNEGKIEIGYADYFDNEKNYLVIFVKDNGYGIPKHILDKVFDPFFTTKPDGTGLGLSICQKIVMEHGGFIKVKSEEGKGTTLMVFLPYINSKH